MYSSIERALWILLYDVNPFIAINEIILGLRIPRNIYYCDETGNEGEGRVRCDKCRREYSLSIWSGAWSLFNWLGIICPDCGEPIPCRLCIATRIVLLPIYPVAMMFRRYIDKAWRKYQIAKTSRSIKAQQSAGSGSSILNVILLDNLFSITMYTIMLIYEFASQNKPITIVAYENPWMLLLAKVGGWVSSLLSNIMRRHRHVPISSADHRPAPKPSTEQKPDISP